MGKVAGGSFGGDGAALGGWASAEEGVGVGGVLGQQQAGALGLPRMKAQTL